MKRTPVSRADQRFMRRAIELARRGWGRVAPNPMVGAVVVREGEIVGEGWHAEFGGPHAEIEALRDAGPRAAGATLYVSLEPCAHHGKTPPCSDAVVAAGIARLVYACPDPNPEARGGAAVIAGRGVDVLAGVEEQRARDLNAAFFHAFGATGMHRPFVELKLALSLDAKIADRDRRSAWITSEVARDEVHRMRAGFDAIGVGVGTVIADDPLLTARGAMQPRRPAVRVVFDRRLRLPPEGKIVRTAAEQPVWVVGDEGDAARRARLEEAGVRVVSAPDLSAALAVLRAEGITSLLVEGGARLASALLALGAVDRLSLFYAPLLLGPEGLDPFGGLHSPPIGEAIRWRHVQSRALGPDTLVTLAP
jgi:diaminohydroxyphosphoribosylaminopyrimidine deaminase/5-amino-6-(5-phosphoribosylamino)uracil reductase